MAHENQLKQKYNFEIDTELNVIHMMSKFTSDMSMAKQARARNAREGKKMPIKAQVN